MRKHSTTHSFLAVADVGQEADYTREVRHSANLFRDFTPSKRSSARQLRELCSELECVLGVSDLHAWLVDERGEPVLFVSGLLAVREGRATKPEVEALNKRLLPQLTGEQSMKDHRFLVKASVGVSVLREAFDFIDDPEERECWWVRRRRWCLPFLLLCEGVTERETRQRPSHRQTAEALRVSRTVDSATRPKKGSAAVCSVLW